MSDRCAMQAALPGRLLASPVPAAAFSRGSLLGMLRCLRAGGPSRSGLLFEGLALRRKVPALPSTLLLRLSEVMILLQGVQCRKILQ